MADAGPIAAEAALALHRSGRLAQAASAYRAILLTSPCDPAALHGLGVLAYQQGRASEASALLAEAARSAPARTDIGFDLGLALLASGDVAAAASQFQAAAEARPDWPEAWYNLGNARRDLGDAPAAMRAFRRALRLRPAYAQAEVNLANLLNDEGRSDQAVTAYRRVLARDPALPGAQNNLGAALVATGDLRAAEVAFRTALALLPDFPAALANLATLMACEGSLERRAEARRLFGQGLALARAQMATGEAGSTASVETRIVLGECLLGLRAHEEAAAWCRQTVAAFPGILRGKILLAEVLRGWGHFAEALAVLGPPSAGERRDSLRLRGLVLRDLRRLDESASCLRRLVRDTSGQAVARYDLAQVLLAAGNFTDGFSLFEARVAVCRPAVQPGRAWDGKSPKGQRILVVAEEGLGDTIQFARWIPRLIALGACVTCLVPAPLMRLLGGLEGGPIMLPMGAAAPPGDAWALVMSLPRLMGMGDIAALGQPYLRADPAAMAARLQWLPQGRLRIGLAWAGNPDYAADHLRSIPPDLLAPLMDCPGVHWVCLQPGAPADAIPGGRLLVPADTGDLADTAALIWALDLVITVDSAMAHLAGALGRHVWLLNRFGACWRWQTGTQASVWYASLEQFRQEEPGDWRPVVEAVMERLRALR